MTILCGHHDESTTYSCYISERKKEEVLNKVSLVTVGHVKLTGYLDCPARALSTDS